MVVFAIHSPSSKDASATAVSSARTTTPTSSRTSNKHSTTTTAETEKYSYDDNDDGADDDTKQPNSPNSPRRTSLIRTLKQNDSSADADIALDDDERRFMIFNEWMKSNGARFPHLTLRRYASDYRGVHAVCRHGEITKGKTLLKIPHKILVTVELAKQSAIGKLLQPLTSLGSQALLAMYLLAEKYKGELSTWKPWLDVLPQSFNTLPMFFNSEELSLLTGSHDLLIKIKSQQKSMRDEFHSINRIKGLNNDYPLFCYDDFVWACLAVGTRVFSLCINGVKTSVLAPLADMMNHKNPAGTNWTYDSKKQSFVLTACTSLNDGDAVYESYGVKDNKRFFASYGFVLEENPANEVTVVIRADLSSPPPSASSTSTVDTSSPQRTFTIRQVFDGAVEEMLSHCRSNAATYEYSTSARQHYSHASVDSHNVMSLSYNRPATAALSVDNELIALYALRCACRDHLRQYDTTMEDDIITLSPTHSHDDNNTQLSTNARNCIIFRLGEKRIYRWLIDFVTEAVTLLCSSWEEAKGKVRNILDSTPEALRTSPVLCSCPSYVSGVIVPLLQEKSRVMQHQQQQHQQHHGRQRRVYKTSSVGGVSPILGMMMMNGSRGGSISLNSEDMYDDEHPSYGADETDGDDLDDVDDSADDSDHSSVASARSSSCTSQPSATSPRAPEVKLRRLSSNSPAIPPVAVIKPNPRALAAFSPAPTSMPLNASRSQGSSTTNNRVSPPTTVHHSTTSASPTRSSQIRLLPSVQPIRNTNTHSPLTSLTSYAPSVARAAGTSSPLKNGSAFLPDLLAPDRRHTMPAPTAHTASTLATAIKRNTAATATTSSSARRMTVH